MKLYLKIKQVRQEKGLTQKQLAEKVGIDYQTISNYENQRFSPSIERAIEIAHALDVTMDDLVDIDAYMDIYHEKLNKIMND